MRFTEAIATLGWELVVVGDTVTPDSWRTVAGCHYLSIRRQNEVFPTLSRLIPERSYARKNLGFLYAIQLGATEIWELDDDNFPHSDPNALLQMVDSWAVEGVTWVNHFKVFYPEQEIWPRGFPLGKARGAAKEELKLAERPLGMTPDIVQFSVDGEPDVDAVCRLANMAYGPPLKASREPILLTLGPSQWSPLNTQNTLWRNPARFRWLYHPFTVSMRFSDIYKMFVAQMYCSVGFGPSTVEQDRNAHDLLKDFQEEFEMHLTSPRLVAELANLRSLDSVTEVYQMLASVGLIARDDVKAVTEFEKLLERL